MYFRLFPMEKQNHDSSHLSCLEIRSTTRPRHYATHAHQRYPKAGIGAWWTLLRTPLVGNRRLPTKDTEHAAWPRNFEEVELQLDHKSESDLRMSHARPGRGPARCNFADRVWPTVGEIGISQAGSGFGPLFECITGRARCSWPDPAWPFLTCESCGPTRKSRWVCNLFLLQFENITKRDVFRLFSLELKCHGS